MNKVDAIEGTVEGLTARRRAEGGAEGVGVKREERTLEERFDDGPDQAVRLSGGEVLSGLCDDDQQRRRYSDPD